MRTDCAASHLQEPGYNFPPHFVLSACRVVYSSTQVQVTLLADRGFEHAALVRWLRQQQWSWAIRVKSDLAVTLANGQIRSVEHLTPPP
ncbi:transposase [Leptothermofonsia sp. ETS-13]|uniref:transposase n=1 Tax=Leptothermofonsia sp. ETS-13 TaxID=3035696 RepID=UPI003BA1C07B